MARRTKEEAAATRELLLDTAENVFLERGVTRASLQGIASAAGVTRGAIYWHFKDKAELFTAMMDRAILPCEAVDASGSACPVQRSQTAAAPQESTAPPAAPLERLRALLLTPLEQLRDDERTRRVFTIAIHRTEYNDDMRAARDRHDECIGEYIAEIAALLQSARDQGHVRADLPIEATARVLFALIDGLLSRYTVHPDPAEGVTTAEVGLDLLLAGMRV